MAGLYSDDCTEVILWLADAQPEVAARCILDIGPSAYDGLLLRLREKWLSRLADLESDPQPEARAAVGRALGRLRLTSGEPLDNRPGVGLTAKGLPDIAWVQIPGGEFIHQEGKDSIETFHIARYPVTNIQFDIFLDAKDGYDNDQWWEGLEDADRNRKPGRWSYSSHPRETVSWYEATACCRWLSERLGYKVSLPTKRHWERAARGREGRKYPWGATYEEAGHANMREPGGHYVSQTSAVGIYPAGAAKESHDTRHPIYDLAGNVWEWCASDGERPDQLGLARLESRAVCGGSWNFTPDVARADDQFLHALPHYRTYSIGFRMMCSSPVR